MIVLPAVASLARIKVNEYEPDGIPVVLNVNVQLSVKVAVITFPLESANVADAPVLP